MACLQESISTGTLADPSQPNGPMNGTPTDRAADIDWNTPMAGSTPGPQKASDFDWNTPVSDHNWDTPSSDANKADAIDWGAPVINKVRFDDELDLDLGLGGDSETEEEENEELGGGES